MFLLILSIYIPERNKKDKIFYATVWFLSDKGVFLHDSSQSSNLWVCLKIFCGMLMVTIMFSVREPLVFQLFSPVLLNTIFLISRSTVRDAHPTNQLIDSLSFSWICLPISTVSSAKSPNGTSLSTI